MPSADEIAAQVISLLTQAARMPNPALAADLYEYALKVTPITLLGRDASGSQP